MRSKLITKENSKMKNMIVLFLLAQPFLDLMTSLSVRFTNLEVLSLGVVVRTAFMIGIGLYVLIQKDKDARLFKAYYIILGLYLMLFLMNIVASGESHLLISEVKSLVKTFYFPIVLTGLWYINKKENLFEHNDLFKLILLQYLVVIFIATITGTSFNSYRAGYGSVGWFFAANEKGAIISILLPSLFLPLINRKWNIKHVASFSLLIFSVFYVGTKVPPISLVLFFFGMMLVTLFGIIIRNEKVLRNFIKVTGVTLILSLVLSVNSPLLKNLDTSYGRFFEGSSSILVGEQTDEEKEKEIKDKEIEKAILSSRNLYRDLVKENYNGADSKDKFIGIGYFIEDDKGEITNKLIEMDFHDIFYRHGFAGTSIYFLPLLIMAVVLLGRFFKNFMKNMARYDMISICYSILIGLSTGAVTGHVLTSPGVSIYVAVSVVILDSMTQGKTYVIE